MSDFIRHDKESAPEASRELLSNIEQGFGFIPELFHYMAEAPVTIKAYTQLDELLKESSLSDQQVQLALLTASTTNDCEFCKVAHHAMARQAGVGADTIKAIKSGDDPEEPKDRALVQLVRSMVQERGFVPEQVQKAFLDAGFEQQQILELVLAVSLKTLSNYTNHLTHPEPNPELKAMTE